MFFIKSVIYILIFSSSTYIGILISKQYTNRVKELNELKSALNVLKTKIRYTNAPLYSIFKELSDTCKGNVSNLFKNVCKNMKNNSAQIAWENAVKTESLSLYKEDREALITMGNLLGKTDLNGQISEIELTEIFLETQLVDAQNQRNKNEKLYKTLGIVTGIGIIVILI